MPRCEGTLKNGQPCRYQAHPGHSTCGVHAAQGHPVEIVRCMHESLYETRCGRACEPGQVWCPWHVQREAQRQEEQRRRRVFDQTLARVYSPDVREQLHASMRANPDPAATHALLDTLFRNWNVDLPEEDVAFFHQHLGDQMEFWLHVYHQIRRPPRETAPPKPRLAALAQDSQNVHTAEVNKQTKDGTSLLLETAVPAEQDTLAEIAAAWAPRKAKTVLDDVTNWYEHTYIRKEGDALYKRCLDGLWARIKASADKTELIQRLWEECKEAKGKCAEGHVSRLCNVFVGFDLSFQAPVPVGEILQGKMAAIAAKDLRVEHKVGEAWVVFEELGIPMNERMDWLEAF